MSYFLANLDLLDGVMPRRGRRVRRIDEYVDNMRQALRSTEDPKLVAPDQMERNAAARSRILDHLKEADKLASEIRSMAPVARADSDRPSK